MLQRVGWVATGHAGTQVVRFASNLVLTRILAPDLFGIMVVLTSIRVGLELFTDIGIGQNIVAHQGATDERFYNTAWTAQVVRGLLLALLSLALLPVLGNFYDQPQLNQLLPYLSLFFIIAGFNSVGLPLAIKALNTKRVAAYEMSSALLGSALLVGAAALVPTVWGLLAGNLISVAVSSVLTYFVMPGIRPRFVIDREHLREIIGLGKWIFISSVVYFLAMNFDRLILAKYVTFAALGLYGLARSLGDVASQFASKVGTAIIFPGVASSGLIGVELRGKLSRKRRYFVLASLVGIAGLVAGSDLIIRVLYDHRYIGAAAFLPWIGFAAWVGILNTLNESVLMGLRRPAFMAAGNAAKFICILASLPPLVLHLGAMGAALATLAGEFARWLVLSLGKARVGIGFLRQDIVATLLLVGSIVAARMLLHAMGLTGTVSDMLNIS